MSASKLLGPWTQLISIRLKTNGISLCNMIHHPTRVRLNNTIIQQCHRYSSQSENAGHIARPIRQTPRDKPALRKRPPGGGGYPLLAIPFICVGLGIWQIRRREWKLKLIDTLDLKLSSEPIPLPENLNELRTKKMEYTKVKVRGTFDHSKELFIGPRASVHDPETHGGLASSSDKAQSMGVHVVTPFKLADRPETILVNRGHVLFKKQPHQLRKGGQVEGEVELVGVVRLQEAKPIIGEDPVRDGYWMSRNIKDMSKMADTEQIFLDADLQSTVPGGPTGGQTRVTLRNEHLTYIFIWFTLAGLTYFLWYKNYRSTKPPRKVIEFLNREHTRM